MNFPPETPSSISAASAVTESAKIRRRPSGDPLLVCIVADDIASAAYAADVLDRACQAAATSPLFLSLDDQMLRVWGDTLAGAAFQADMLVVARRNSAALPARTEAWLDLWARRRPRAKKAAIIGVVSHSPLALQARSPLMDHLERLAARHDLDFIHGCAGLPRSTHSESLALNVLNVD